MSKGLGRIELFILSELRQGGAQSINRLGITLVGGQGLILKLSTKTSAWQTTARAVRSLIKKGLICRVEGSKSLLKLLNT